MKMKQEPSSTELFPDIFLEVPLKERKRPSEENEFLSNLYLFSIESSKTHEKLLFTFLNHEKQKEFEINKSYMLVHFKKSFQLETTDESETLETILKTIQKELSPLKQQYTFSLKSTNLYAINLYLWNGNSTTKQFQNELLNVCHEIEMMLNSNFNSIQKEKQQLMDTFAFKNFIKRIYFMKNFSKTEISNAKSFEKTFQKYKRQKSPRHSPELTTVDKGTLQPKRKSADYEESPRKKTPRTPRKISIPMVPSTPRSQTSSSRGSLENEITEFDHNLIGASAIPVFSKICSKIRENLFLGSDLVARNKELLMNNGITHILNCARITCDDYFPEDFTYKSMNLYDSGSQNLIGLFFETVEFMESAISNGGRVYVHCVQGVSRSSAFMLAFLIWKERETFRNLLEDVKSKRVVCSPNAGFIVQLMRWENFILHHFFKESLLFRISPLNSNYGIDHKQIGPLLCNAPLLDSRTSFILYDSNKIFIWNGSKSKEGLEERAKMFIACFQSINDVKIDNLIEIFNEELETEEFQNSLNSIKIPKFTQVDMMNPYPELKSFESMNDSFVNVKEKALKKKNKAKLFNYDDDDEYWDDYGTFNRLDLNPDQVYVLAPEEEKIIWVWKGEDCLYSQDLIELGKQFIHDKKKDSFTLVKIFDQQNENENFWKYFGE
jgi:hypothetical protein